MYSKDEVRDLKKRFWDGLSTYAEQYSELKGRKHKFMLHNTRLKGVTMKFDATRSGAFVILEIDHRSEERQEKLCAHFEEYRQYLDDEFEGNLIWDKNYTKDCGKRVVRIYCMREGLDIHRQEQWNDFYEYLVANMIKMERGFTQIKVMWDMWEGE